MNGPTQVGFEKLSDLLDDIEQDPWLDFSRSGSGSSMVRERLRPDVGFETGRRPGYQINAKQRLANAIGAPQAVVKIVRGGGTGTRSDLVAQLSYLSREGGLVLDEYGFNGRDFFVEGQSDIHDLSQAWVARWARAEALDGRSAQTKAKTYHLIVSFPEGMNEVKAHKAADTFAERFLSSGEFGDHWSHVRAWHTDRAHPHMHIIVDRRGASGKMMQINPKRAITPERLRALQVDAAAEHGLLMNDTPRLSRGRRGTAQTSAAWRHDRRSDPSDRCGHRLTQESPSQGLTGGAIRLEAQELRKLEGMVTISASLNPNDQTQTKRFLAALNDAATALEHGKDLPSMDIATLERDGVTPQALAALTPDDLIQTMRNVVSEAERLSPRLADEEKRTLLDVETGKIKQLYSDRVPEFASSAELIDADDGLLSPVIENRQFAKEVSETIAMSFGAGERGYDDNDIGSLRPVEVTSPAQTLEGADHRVKQAYAARGMNGDRALARIKGGLEATAETREAWYYSEIRERHAVFGADALEATAEIEDLHKYASKMYRAAVRAIGHDVSLDAVEAYAPKDSFADQLRQRPADGASLTADHRVPEPAMERDGLSASNIEGPALSDDASDWREVGDDRLDPSKEARTRTEQPDTQELSSKRNQTEEERRLHFAEIENRIAEEDARIASEEGFDRKSGLSRGR